MRKKRETPPSVLHCRHCGDDVCVVIPATQKRVKCECGRFAYRTSATKRRPAAAAASVKPDANAGVSIDVEALAANIADNLFTTKIGQQVTHIVQVRRTRGRDDRKLGTWSPAGVRDEVRRLLVEATR